MSGPVTVAEAHRLAAVPARSAAPARTPEEVAIWDHVGDPLAEALVSQIRSKRLTRMDPLVAARTLAAEGNEAATNFLADVEYVPTWARFEDMYAGAGLGNRSPIGTAVAVHGALPATYIDPNGADLLVMTGRLGAGGDYPRRMWESFTGFIGGYDVDGMRPGGKEWERWVRIRIMHTRVRMGVLSSGKWPRDGRPIPISALGAVGGAYVFGIYRANLCRLFSRASDEEISSYALMWRWIARILGAPPELLADDDLCQLRIDLLTMRTLYAPNENAATLTASALEGLTQMLPFALLPRPVHEAVGRYTLTPDCIFPPYLLRLVAKSGDPELVELVRGLRADSSAIADAFGIPRRPVLTRAVAAVALGARVAAQPTRIRAVDRWVQGVSGRFLRDAVARGLGGVDATYDTPMDGGKAA
ncbi:MAG: hypothetical protein ACTHOG_03420 [Marmoricola sp.]